MVWSGGHIWVWVIYISTRSFSPVCPAVTHEVHRRRWCQRRCHKRRFQLQIGSVSGGWGWDWETAVIGACWLLCVLSMWALRLFDQEKGNSHWFHSARDWVCAIIGACWLGHPLHLGDALSMDGSTFSPASQFYAGIGKVLLLIERSPLFPRGGSNAWGRYKINK